MRYPVQLEGFEGQSLEVVPAGLVSGPRLLVNGQPAAAGPKRGQMVLRRNDGRVVAAAWRPRVLGLDVPRLEVEGRRVDVVAPLPWYAWVWSALPIGLVAVGGALGALAGFIGFAINTRVFRSGLPRPAQWALTALVSVLAGVVYLAVATGLYVLIRGGA